MWSCDSGNRTMIVSREVPAAEVVALGLVQIVLPLHQVVQVLAQARPLALPQGISRCSGRGGGAMAGGACGGGGDGGGGRGGGGRRGGGRRRGSRVSVQWNIGSSLVHGDLGPPDRSRQHTRSRSYRVCPNVPATS